jgi:hypothetical protein
MPAFNTIGVVAATTAATMLLVGCGQQSPPADIDPALGRSCFEAHQAALPPGSQYEGIADASEARVTIRSMTGARVEEFSCSLATDGTITAIRQ